MYSSKSHLLLEELYLLKLPWEAIDEEAMGVRVREDCSFQQTNHHLLQQVYIQEVSYRSRL